MRGSSTHTWSKGVPSSKCYSPVSTHIQSQNKMDFFVDTKRATAPLIKCRQHPRLSSIDFLTAYLMRAKKKKKKVFNNLHLLRWSAVIKLSSMRCKKPDVHFPNRLETFLVPKSSSSDNNCLFFYYILNISMNLVFILRPAEWEVF